LPVSFVLEDDQEAGEYRIVVTARKNGTGIRAVLDSDFFHSPEVEEIVKLFHELHIIGDSPFTLVEKDKQTTLSSYREVADAILDRSRHGIEIQRYKGLGEMNPEQLWQTTMNPDDRTLLQVKVEDAYEADEIFTTLMGDEVEPRRRFIEENALAVKNLDI
jgi:DNA gyrase subunit B